MSISIPEPWRDLDGGQFDYFVICTLDGNFSEMERLLKAGHDINSATEDGETAFSWCCARNKFESAKWLYQHGADFNHPLSGDPPFTPLDCAITWASPEFRTWLRSVGGVRNHDYPEGPWPPPDLPDDDSEEDGWVRVVG